MSTTFVAAAVLAGHFTHYAPPSNALPRVEAVTDRGPMLELIVRCPSGTAIMSYSKLERVYCGPKAGCVTERTAAMRRACR